MMKKKTTKAGWLLHEETNKQTSKIFCTCFFFSLFIYNLHVVCGGQIEIHCLIQSRVKHLALTWFRLSLLLYISFYSNLKMVFVVDSNCDRNWHFGFYNWKWKFLEWFYKCFYSFFPLNEIEIHMELHSISIVMYTNLYNYMPSQKKNQTTRTTNPQESHFWQQFNWTRI